MLNLVSALYQQNIPALSSYTQRSSVHPPKYLGLHLCTTATGHLELAILLLLPPALGSVVCTTTLGLWGARD